MLGSVLILGELTKELQDLIGELIEEAEFKGKQVMPSCLLFLYLEAWISSPSFPSYGHS